MNTKVNSFDVSSSLDFNEVISFKFIIYVGELYTFLYLNVIRVLGVSTNHRLKVICQVPPPRF